MSRINFKTVMILTITLALAGFTTYTFAGKAAGGACPALKKAASCPVTGKTAGASDETMTKLQEAESAFRKSTEALATQIRMKKNDFYTELMKEVPDKAKVTALHGELQKLQNNYDSEELLFLLKTREEIPEASGLFRYHHGIASKKTTGYSCAASAHGCPVAKTKGACPVK